MEYDKVSKIPSSIADARNIIDISKRKNQMILTYDIKQHFSDDTTSLEEKKTIIITYNKKIKSFDVQVDEEDNVFLGVVFKPPFSFFGWRLTKDNNAVNPSSTTNI
jgi:hypothetical protein